jgi:hypothetical protein
MGAENDLPSIRGIVARFPGQVQCSGSTPAPALGTIGYDIENRVTGVLGDVYGYAPDRRQLELPANDN